MSSDPRICEFEDWLFECSHYLHSARIYKEFQSGKPQMRSGDPIIYIDSIMRVISKKNEITQEKTNLLIYNKDDGEPIYIPNISVTFSDIISQDDYHYLKETLKKIVREEWNNINSDEIESSHEILYRLLLSVKSGTKKIKAC